MEKDGEKKKNAHDAMNVTPEKFGPASTTETERRPSTTTRFSCIENRIA